MIANDHELGYQCEESEASVTAGSGGLVGVQGGSTEDSMIFGPSGGTLDSLMASVLLADCTDRVDNENEAASGTVPTGSPNKGKSAGERLTRNNCGSENKVEEEVPADDADKTEKPMSPRSQTQDVQDELAELRSDKQIKDLQIDELQRELSDLKSLLQKTIVTSLQSRSNSVPLHQHVYCPPTGGVANEFVPQSDSDTWGNISTTEAATLLVDTSKGTVTGGDLTVLAPSALPHHKAVRANGVIARLSSQAAAATAAAAAENSQRSAEPPTSAASSATSVFDYPDSLISGSASAEPGPLFRAFSAASSFEGEFRRASSAPSAPAISNTRGIIPPPIVTGKSIWSIDDATTLGPFSGLLGSDSAVCFEGLYTTI
ncbi:hypothetical protein DFJ73DRAFT_449619 [Zopfochytrium polystomum]|nr:hypothetical protein DFJ73DRAFT_449619 [Zopfochytrium polystomum]